MLLHVVVVLHYAPLAILWVRGQACAWMYRVGAAAAHAVHLRLLLFDDVVVVDDHIILQLDIVSVS